MPQRPVSAEVLEFLRGVDSPTVSNAIETFGVRELIAGFSGSRIRCLFPQLGVTLGFAVTCQVDTTSPGPAAVGKGLRQLCEVIDAAPKPVVLVYQDIGSRPGGAASFGDFAATLVQRIGAVALVCDGAIRDGQAIQALGFQCFASGTTASHGNPRLVNINTSVVVDGLSVEPGDLLHGDDNGVVSVPLVIVDQLPQAIEAVRRQEQAALAIVRSPDFTLDAGLKSMGH